MYISDKTKRLVLISIFVGLLIVLLLLVLLSRRNNTEVPADVTPQIEEPVIDNTSESQVIVPSAQQDVEREVVPGTADQGIVAKQTAAIFVERFSTYSTQNDNTHITSVEPLVTTKMWGWVSRQGQDQDLRAYSGMTTRVIASRLTAFDAYAGTATVRIQARQIQESGNDTETIGRAGEVTLIQSENTWLVDGFYWDN